MDRKLTFLIVAAMLFAATVAAFKFGSAGTAALWSVSEGGRWLLPLVLVAALIDSVNPCAFSILLLTVAFLLSIGKLRAKVLQIGSAYIAGLYAVYFLIGLGLLQTLHLFETPHFMGTLGAGLLVLLGVINVTNEFVPAFPVKFAIPQAAHRRMAVLMEQGSVPTAVVLGGLVGICEFPCTGGPYLMVLGLLHDQATYYTGVGYLLLYNVIFVLPLVLILLLASNASLLGKVQQWQQEKRGAMRLGGGAAMIALGSLILLL
jgi:cytochrome c-type biogenesis protein